MTEKHEDDKQEDYIDEGEYQFSDEEELSEEGYDDTDADEGGGMSSKFSIQSVIALIKQRPVIAAFALLVLILLVYTLLGGNKGSTSNQNITTAAFQAPKKAEQPVVAKPTVFTSEALLAKQVKQAQAAAAQKKAAQAQVINKSIFEPISPVFSKGQESLDKLRRQMTQERNDVFKSFAMHYNNKMQLLDSGNKATQQQLRELHANMSVLRGTIKELQHAMEASQKIQKRILFNQGMSFDASGSQMEPVHDMMAAPQKALTIKQSPTYQLQAIVPGRAWLRSNTGEILTVSQGDSVPGMGVVMEIDATSGIVTLNSGRIIGSN